MIRVKLADEPKAFNQSVRQPGLRAIAQMVGEAVPEKRRGRAFKKIAETREQIPAEKFPDYWTTILPELRTAYNHICAYSCFRIHEVTGSATVEHFVAKSQRWDLVYEWSNYRLACSLINSRKQSFEDVLDPFEVQDGWFELELVGFQTIPAKSLSTAIKKRVNETIERLRLNEFCHVREEYFMEYWNGNVNFQTLQKHAPFLAQEISRQGRRLPEDA